MDLDVELQYVKRSYDEWARHRDEDPPPGTRLPGWVESTRTVSQIVAGVAQSEAAAKQARAAKEQAEATKRLKTATWILAWATGFLFLASVVDVVLAITGA